MTQGITARTPPFEARWPVALASLLIILLLALLPGRVRLVPAWVPYALGVVLLLPMAGVRLSSGDARALRLERRIILVMVTLFVLGTVSNLANMVVFLVARSAELNGLQLLETSVSIWFTNVFAFGLLYWQLDRGGPEARMNGSGAPPDWLFPQIGAGDEAPRGWTPAFVDYLFLAYCTATAFSPTDALPLTSRAKLLMMLQSAISLATIVVVAARAINILGG